MNPHDETAQRANATSNRLRIWQSIQELSSAGRFDRQRIADGTGLGLSVVDDHINQLIDDGTVIKVSPGFFDIAPKPRPMILEPYQSRTDRKWRVRIKGANGEKVMVSEAYASEGGALRSAKRLMEAGKQGFEIRPARDAAQRLKGGIDFSKWAPFVVTPLRVLESGE